MVVNRRLLNWGVFFIALGAVVLAAQSASIDAGDVAAALRLWPVLVIALGVGVLLRRTRFSIAGGMLAAAVVGLLLGGMLVAAPVAVAEVGPACNGIRPTTMESRDGSFAGPASVDLRLICGELTVTTQPGSGWHLEAGNGTGVDAAIDASADRLAVASSTRDRPFGFVRGSDAFRVTLPTATSIDLAAEVSAGRGTLDLAGARLGRMQLVVNAGDVSLDLGGATLAHLAATVNGGSASVGLPSQDFGADLVVNAGAFRICAPDDLGLRIRHQGVLAATTYAGLVRTGDTWESPGYATADHHADVTVSANVASVDVNPMGGCK